MAQQSEPLAEHHRVDGSHPAPGRTSIVDSIVTTIAGLAARGVEGVHRLDDALAPAPQERPDHTGSLHRAAGVSACVGARATTVRLALVVDHGTDVRRLVGDLRASVGEVIGSLTGLHVLAVDVDVLDVARPAERPRTGEPDER